MGKGFIAWATLGAALLVGASITPGGAAAAAEQHVRGGAHKGHVARGHRGTLRIGVTLATLPPGHVALSVRGRPYYRHDGWFYRRAGKGFVVVAPPVGAVVTSLPAGYVLVNVGPGRYYRVNGAWYVWSSPRRGYVVVDPPETQSASVPATEALEQSVYVYPGEGQTEQQQARDRYECHAWAVGQTGVDPSTGAVPASGTVADYRRAESACLLARGYTVN